jgi:hypothetical protein
MCHLISHPACGTVNPSPAAYSRNGRLVAVFGSCIILQSKSVFLEIESFKRVCKIV